MPTYEYECGSCHHRFERKQRFDAKPVAICPKCRGKASRVFHSNPIIFKGRGFYTTDSRKGMPELGKGGEELAGGKKEKK